MQLSLDPLTGQLVVDEDSTGNVVDIKLARFLHELPSLERRVLRWLFGIGGETRYPAEIAERLNLTEAEVWVIVQGAFEFIGASVISELAA